MMISDCPVRKQAWVIEPLTETSNLQAVLSDKVKFYLLKLVERGHTEYVL